MLKYVFRKRDNEFLGRFDPDCPICVLNPISKQKVIGEVELYKIENPYLEIEQPEVRYPKDQPIKLNQTFGKFIGTDYTFIQDKKLQNTVLNNVLEEDRQKFIQFKGLKKLDITI